MKLQHDLVDISSVCKNAYDVANFIKKDNDIYYFDTFHHMEFDYGTFRYRYSDSIYTKDYADKSVNPEIYEAFYELETFIIENLLPDGTLDPAALSESLLPQNTISYTNIQSTIDNLPKASTEVNINPLFCSCSAPSLVKSQAGGVEFDYCRGCKKEYQKILTKRSGWVYEVPF